MITKHPRLRCHTRRAPKKGKVTVYYFYDMRSDGKPDIPLGKDYALAVQRWDEIHNRRARVVGTLMEAFEAWETNETEGLLSYPNKETQRGYRKQLNRLKPVFGEATWDSVDLPALKAYLRKRSAKTQANREMSVLQIIWNWARGEGYTSLPWPAAGMERSGWKNEEQAREFEVTPELFQAVYEQADQVLRDCMDIASATAMRLTDARKVVLPAGNILRLKANKTGKKADFDVNLSQVLPDLIERRRTYKANHLMLLSRPDGHPVSYWMLRDRWDAARAAAAEAAEEAGDHGLAALLRKMFLRDMRKMASDLVEDEYEAQKLLQHGSVTTTRKHYRTRGSKLKPAR